MAVYQIFVRLLDGKTRCLQIPGPTISGEALKRDLFDRTGIPLGFQRLITGCREFADETLIHASEDGFFPSCNLLLRLPGGKGGFGSLLRGAATKAGQKKTHNFDACRDMSGRRLRHVNAEKKLEEWKAEAEDRKLEKIAEQFLKKKAKEVRKSSSSGVEKYIAKYREDSEKCMENVEESVRQSFGLYEKSKRRILPSSGPASKRLKIWLGKKKVDENDSDACEGDSDADDADEKSVVLNTENQEDRSSDSVSGCQSEGEASGGGSAQSNIEEENALCNIGCSESEDASGTEVASADSDGSSKPQIPPCIETNADNVVGNCEDLLGSNVVSLTTEGSIEPEVVIGEHSDAERTMGSSGIDLIVGETLGPKLVPNEQVDTQRTLDSCTENSSITGQVKLTKSTTEPELVIPEESVTNIEELNFDNFNSATEMEVLGMERLKIELQSRGLKCGGTLRERAARLFLLKSMPVEKLPKKLLAKPSTGEK